jgi:hypothetical protein
MRRALCACLQGGAFVVPHPPPGGPASLRAALHSALVLAATPFISFVLPLAFAPAATPIALPLHCLVQLAMAARILWLVPTICRSAAFAQPFVRRALQEVHAWLQLLSLLSPLPLTPLRAGAGGPSACCQQTLAALLAFVGLWVPTGLQAASEWRWHQQYLRLQRSTAQQGAGAMADAGSHGAGALGMGSRGASRGTGRPGAGAGTGWLVVVDRANDRLSAALLPKLAGAWRSLTVHMLVAAAVWNTAGLLLGEQCATV